MGLSARQEKAAQRAECALRLRRAAMSYGQIARYLHEKEGGERCISTERVRQLIRRGLRYEAGAADRRELGKPLPNEGELLIELSKARLASLDGDDGTNTYGEDPLGGAW